MRINHRVNIFNLNMNPVILGFDFGQALNKKNFFVFVSRIYVVVQNDAE